MFSNDYILGIKYQFLRCQEIFWYVNVVDQPYGYRRGILFNTTKMRLVENKVVEPNSFSFSNQIFGIDIKYLLL